MLYQFFLKFIMMLTSVNCIRCKYLYSIVNHRQNVTTDFQQLAHPTFFKKSILLIGIAKATY